VGLTNHDDMVVELSFIFCCLTISSVGLGNLAQSTENSIGDFIVYLIDFVANRESLSSIELSFHLLNKRLSGQLSRL
jgi:hypothetical protein